MPALVVFEGPDGVGKTSIAAAVERELRARGVDCERLSFPGRAPGSLGHLVYDIHHEPQRVGILPVSATSLQLLHVAAHVNAIESAIVPALSAGRIVLLDRYWWSTLVYGRASGVDEVALRSMLSVESTTWRGIVPSVLFLVQRTNSENRQGSERLVPLYRELAAEQRARYRVVQLNNDGSIADAVRTTVKLIMSLRLSRPTSMDEPLFGSTPQSSSSHRSPLSFDSSSLALPRRGPLVFTSVSPARPSKVYDTYWRFAVERQAVFFRRLCGAGQPLTGDAIIAKHKFTNAYRASDRVSQFAIRHVAYTGDQAPEEVFFRLMLFKLFNKIETWELLSDALGEVRYADYDFNAYDKVLTAALRAGIRIYSAAYIMPAATAFGNDKRKHRTHLRLLERLMEDEVPHRLQQVPSMQQAFALLRTYPMLGDFLAYQFITDLNYSELVDFSESEFVVPGPGAKDGIRKCFDDPGGYSEADLIRLVEDRQEVELERLSLSFQSLWGRRLQLIDCQNLFCEVDKYARLAHPDVAGISGRTRIKQQYKETGRPIDYWYPPKWGINERIARFQESLKASTASK